VIDDNDDGDDDDDVYDDDDDDDNNNDNNNNNTSSILVVCNLFSSVWLSTSFPMLWLSDECQSRSKQMYQETWCEVLRNATNISICINVTFPVLREAHFSA